MDRSVRGRLALLRALGQNDPPAVIEIGGRVYLRNEIYKHDSWAATARYQSADGQVVCKFNRMQPIFGLPMAWLGHRLAKREALALRRLAGTRGVPQVCGTVLAEGTRLRNAVAHVYVPGRPLGKHDRPDDEFFPTLLALVAAVHRRQMAYVDLHKRENILLSEDGSPCLVDFQVCFGLWFPHLAKNPILRTVLRALQRADLYHVAKHVEHHRPDQRRTFESSLRGGRPWWIQAHRVFAVPLRQLRRSFLALMRVRAKGGRATTEAFPEDAVRRELERAA